MPHMSHRFTPTWVLGALLTTLLCASCASTGDVRRGRLANLSASLRQSTDPSSGVGASKTGYEDIPQFGGARSVASELEEDHKQKESKFRFDGMQRALAPYYAWTTRMSEQYGLVLGADYTGIYYGASEDLGSEDEAGSGDLRIFGSWTVAGRDSGDTGSIVFKVEHRHAHGHGAVSDLGIATGYVGLLGPPFNGSGEMLTNLYWLQKFNDSRTSIVAGLVDSTDYLDVYGLINPWTHFNNLVFTTGSGTMPAPNQGIGAAVGTFVGDHVYLMGGVADTNGDPTEPGDTLETAFDDAEYFTHFEVGYTSSFDERYTNNTHLTLWHAAEREKAGVASGWGANFSWAQFYGGQVMPFFRMGYSDDGGALLDRSVSAGVGYYQPGTSDLIGFGLNWGRPSQDFGPDPRDQFTSELFYRVQLSQNFALTPTLQFISDPALNPTEEDMWYVGVRARVAL